MAMQEGASDAGELFARFLERYGRHEGFDVQAFAADHPEHAQRLRAFLEELGGSNPTLRALSRLQRTQASTAGRALPADSDLTSSILRRLNERGPSAPRYEQKGELAHGGQGRILRVWDEDLGRQLAMKVTHEAHADAPLPPKSARSIGRFLEEARLTAQLDHPGIVPVHELGLDDEGRVFFTMKLVKGRDLKEIFQLVARGEEGWTQTRALSVLLRVCEGMSYAHAKGVIHRDLKPGNVMVGRFGEVYVMDWGLARVLGQTDTRDLRIREPLLTTQVQSLRHGSASSEPDASLLTMDGDVVGTPAYMSPEQALGNLEAMGPHSDVYSAGAMLYHLLAGHPPYLPPGTRLNNYAIWSRVQEGPPPPLHQRAPLVPAELIAITEKAMAREPARRYRDMSELAEDLRAFLEHRVVRAYETGAVAELRKWVVRNRPLAAAIAAGLLVALGGLATVGWVQARGRAEADEQRRLAMESEKKAKASAEEARRQELLARNERANVLRLSAFQELEELQRRADELWPVRPALADACEAWLADARRLVAALEGDPARGDAGHLALLASLRERALPQTAEERRAILETHPRRAELERLQRRTGSLRHALEVAAGLAQPLAWTLEEDPPATAIAINELAWPLVAPDRVEFGREAEGLALAEVAFELAREHERALVGDTLSWALFANGLDDDALEVGREAVRSAELPKVGEFREYLARLESEIDLRRAHGAAELKALEHAVRSLEWELSGRVFAVDEDSWWHDQLVELVDEIEAFADPRTGLLGRGVSPRFGWGIERRLAFARSLEERSIRGGEAQALWSEAIASIADPALSPRYEGLKIRPQLGLLPCGRDPGSGLWEFAVLGTGAVPGRDAAGRLEFDAGSALVLVLLPGGTFLRGAQRGDPALPGYDPMAEPDESPPREVTLSPFFLSKYEMTQGQWKRCAGNNPSYYQTGAYTPIHPVESVSWIDCRRILGRLALTLPTEAQWEYAARGETETPWWSGEDAVSLAGCANVLDRTAARGAKNIPSSARFELDDGYVNHAPVTAMRANPFGFHGITGNVLEWCLDGYDHNAYRDEPVRDPCCEEQPTRQVVTRGGSFDMPETVARSSCRLAANQDFPFSSIGVRLARPLEE